jgi:SAM-dependent methyltransferase
VADLSLSIDPALVARVAAHVDREGKLIRALDALGPIAGRDVVLVDAGVGLRARSLAEIGGRVTALAEDGTAGSLEAAIAADPPAAGSLRVATGVSRALGLPDEAADVIVAGFSAYRGVDPVEITEADRVLRPAGRLLVVHDYGRDDLARIQPPERPEYLTWSRRDGPFLRAGFRVRVIHCWWTFETVEEAGDLLGDAFGASGRELAAGLHRPRLSYNLAIYHRTRGDVAR